MNVLVRLVIAGAFMLPAASAIAGPSAIPLRDGLARVVTEVAHVAPHQCGVKQASFGRICRASAYASCLRAAKRNVKGYSNLICAERQVACRSCLSHLRSCIAQIGHAKRPDFSCEECTGKFSRCIDKRYPKIE